MSSSRVPLRSTPSRTDQRSRCHAGLVRSFRIWGLSNTTLEAWLSLEVLVMFAVLAVPTFARSAMLTAAEHE